MKYVKSRAKSSQDSPPKQEETNPEPIQITEHNWTKIWRGFWLTILVAALIALGIKYLPKIIVAFVLAIRYVFTQM